LFWHLAHGVLEPLHPKVWLILIGTNDLFDSKCTERFVVANILNVLKTIQEQRPDAQFLIHGILPRKEDPTKKSQFLGHLWKRTQSINFQLRKFCEKYENINYLQGGSFFMEETDVRGRRQIDKNMIEDGVHPTEKGLEVWGDYIVKRVTKILTRAKEAAEKGTTEET
jgi:lysophospholipase L1-like esterase